MLVNIFSKRRIILVAASVVVLLFAVLNMLSHGAGLVEEGKADFTGVDFEHNGSLSLSGQWEFYRNQLLTSEDFRGDLRPRMDTFLNVPGTWEKDKSRPVVYPDHGYATYRLVLKYPASLKDPALRIKSVATAYRFYADGQLLAVGGELSENPHDFKEGAIPLVVELPKATQEIELIFQVGNQNYARGGLRESPVFGSKQVLERQNRMLLAMQLLFIGSVFIFGIHYFLLFLMQKANKTALLFSVLCVITALRASIWGELPLLIAFPNVTYSVLSYINYFTGYNMIAAMLLFLLSIYPSDYKKRGMWLALSPTFLFDAMLLLKSPAFASSFTDYLYLMILLQMSYIIIVMIRAVLYKRDHSILMFFAICVYVLAINQDILHYKGIGGIDLSYAFLFGNFIVIAAMSFVQAKQQADTHQKLVSYNETLVESDKLKDKIMASEMSFLQAQIKPHFLYNALDAIANVCEKDGKQAGKLIIDLAVYLRGSLEFNNLDKMVTIERELEFVDTYFHIEQARFGDKIHLQKVIDAPYDAQIPVLVLQPLVENAVRHGISKKQNGGTVSVRMKKNEDHLLIEIEDDGAGIAPDKLKMLLSDEAPVEGVGLRNIHHRLLKLYGHGLEINSEAGHTCVKIVLPGGA